MTGNPSDTPVPCPTDIAAAYSRQIEQLDQDTDALLRKQQAHAYQLLIELQQQKLELYQSPDFDVDRARQLDHWMMALLQILSEQQGQWFDRLWETRNTLRTDADLMCFARLYSPENPSPSSPSA